MPKETENPNKDQDNLRVLTTKVGQQKLEVIVKVDSDDEHGEVVEVRSSQT